MRWSNEMFYILLLNSFAGAIVYGFWIIAKNGMAKKKKLSFFHFSGNVCLSESIYACSGKPWIILWSFIFAYTVHLYSTVRDSRDMDSRRDI